MRSKFELPVGWRGAAVAVGLVALGAAGATAQETVRHEGTLSIVWGDPRPGLIGGHTRFEIVRADGSKVAARFAPEDRAAAFAAFGKRVAVEGSTETTDAGTVHFTAQRLERLDPVESAGIDAPAALKTRKVLYILLKYKSDTQTPHTPAFFDALTNPKTGNATLKIPASINGYFDKTSWGQLQWQGTVAGNKWFTLPKTKTGYANCGWSGGCADLDQIAADGIALVKAAGVNVALYDNLSFVINNDLDCCAWGGSYVYGGKVFGATWEPPWAQETGTYIHEYGHSIGLPHSGWRYYAYDSPWDDMSGGSTTTSQTCGSYKSANTGNTTQPISCTEPGGGYIAAHKNQLGWLPSANQRTVSTKTTVTYLVQSNATALGTGIKMVKVCLPGYACTGSTARFISIEAKMRVAQFENGLPGDGIVLHDVQMNRGPIGSGNKCFFNTQSGWAVPIDSTAGDYRGTPYCDTGGRSFPNYALFNAQYGAGKTYNNTTWGVKIEVLTKTATGYNVRVTKTK